MIKIEKKDIIQYYIIENHSIDECTTHFGISRTTFKNKLKLFDIHKSKELSTKLSHEKLSEKYGEDYSSIITKKGRENFREIYGVSNPMQVKEFHEKARKTNIEKYGGPAPINSEEVKEKIQKTNLEKYGNKCSLKNKDIKRKSNDELLRKFGCLYPLASERKDELLKKRKKTNLEKYGTEEITESEYFKNKVREICLEKYGTTSPNESIYSTTIFSDINSFKLYLEKFTSKPTVKELTEDLDVSDSYILKQVKKINGENLIIISPSSSQYEKEIKNFILSLGIQEDDIVERCRDIISGELDLYIPKYSLAIEFNGTYWHSNLYKNRNYHQKKSIECEEKGIRLIHIYEYEWLDLQKKKIIQSIIKAALGLTQNRIFARKCIVEEVSNITLKDFLNENHLQGFKGAQRAYVLKDNLGKILQVMTFSFDKKKNVWEIIREASLIDYTIIGGSSKLFKRFLNDVKPKIVFSYCDFNKFTGNGYLKLGMEFDSLTVPDMKWITPKGVFNRNPTKHKEMKDRANAQIFGAGSKKYLIKF